MEIIVANKSMNFMTKTMMHLNMMYITINIMTKMTYKVVK